MPLLSPNQLALTHWRETSSSSSTRKFRTCVLWKEGLVTSFFWLALPSPVRSLVIRSLAKIRSVLLVWGLAQVNLRINYCCGRMSTASWWTSELVPRDSSSTRIVFDLIVSSGQRSSRSPTNATCSLFKFDRAKTRYFVYTLSTEANCMRESCICHTS